MILSQVVRVLSIKAAELTVTKFLKEFSIRGIISKVKAVGFNMYVTKERNCKDKHMKHKHIDELVWWSFGYTILTVFELFNFEQTSEEHKILKRLKQQCI